jgi:uncharacterized lipoprotein YbaY
MPRTRVRCRVVLPPDAVIAPGARLHIAIEDVSLADAPARPVAVADFPAAPADATMGPFELDASLAPGARHYALRVHLDQSGDGRVTPGDFVNPARHSVSPGAPEREFDVALTQVRDAP